MKIVNKEYIIISQLKIFYEYNLYSYFLIMLNAYIYTFLKLNLDIK
ncbi:hypothetical protein BCL90_4385 [Pedobacter alluvionis]|uniref:Uncharacterized protein n=1 Tax=Pedobacter alluvionis TaxID=475253 RepID=A0A497XVR3_9SPHI|nr:hypothetical protein BCL90_4385 [Pedobacter alluvionis]